MNEQDYPALWRSADLASARNQRRYLNLVRVHLALLTVSGFVAAWNPTDVFADKAVSWTVAIAMLLALVISFTLKLLKLDDAWFRTRALAENAKEAAWRYMMRPAAGPGDEADPVRAEYLDTLHRIESRFPSAAKDIALAISDGDEITQRMREVRAMSLSQRSEVYAAERLQNQIDWYTAKTKLNASAESRWFWFILATEAAAVIAAVVRVEVSQEFNPTGGVAALAACLVAWLQTKRFSDLANTYAVAAMDLRLIKERFGQAKSEAQLLALVDEAERAISREHRLWVERRIGSGG